ncbi:response regulator [Oceanicola sp. S124]|uniref:response regulator n=1 Tax=Oceanicola sp. S124 TaxID=1042378 RepID=UPI0002559A4B|nr:response regulator [Oceanicola sp. S124]
MEVFKNEPERLPVMAPATGVFAVPPEPEPPLIDVLVLDDSRFDAMQLQRECRSTDLPVRVSIATGIDEFRQMLQARRYHVVFIDYLLPDGDGLAAQEILRGGEKNGQSPVVMISGEARHDVAVEAIRRGCIDYKAKSDLTREALKGLILRALEEGSKIAEQTLRRALQAQREELVAAMREIVREELSRGTGHHDPGAETLRMLRSYGLVPDGGDRDWGDLTEDPAMQFIFRKH